ncbi:hypothetical protein, partial [Romboutsia sp.]|uniref:hypothetical protein n=1 Tax=Romboutsia sp. TaxID=1965302 RepID=UPI002C472481
IYKILSELKPLIFSDLATFIIICGQKLHYKYIESETLDDPFISSLFTHTIHTPLATRSQLQQVFEKYIIKNENNKDLDYDTINKYVDMLIFKSNGILRKFNNEISKELIWEDKKAFLYIDESLFNNKIDSEIVDIIENIVNDSTDVISVMKDYLTQQLYIWSKKIKYKIKFSENDILDLKEYESQSYLQPYIEEIYIWFNRLISYMISANILEREEKDGIINYKITVDAGFKNENSENSNQKSIFMKDNEVRKFVNLIDQVIMYGSILCSCINIDVNNKLDKVLISLDENKLIVRESFISYNLDDINILYESIVNNTLNEITSKHRMLIKESTHYIKNIRSFILRNIIFEYTKMRIDNNCLNIKIEKQIAKIDWAFYLVNEDEKILFKIIYRESGTKAPVIDRYNKTSKFSKIVNIVLDENIVKNDKYFYNTNITNTGRILQFNNKEYKDNIYFYDIHITREENITELLESKVWDIINEVLINDKSRLEVATTIY